MTRHVTLPLTAICLTLCLLYAAGCGRPEATRPAAPSVLEQEANEHTHGETGPHNGHLIELGPFHVELASDHTSPTTTLYLLDGQLQPVHDANVAAATVSVFRDGDFVDFPLQAADAPGVFTSHDEQLAESLHHDLDIQARVRMTVDDKELIGKYEHEAHATGAAHQH